MKTTHSLPATVKSRAQEPGTQNTTEKILQRNPPDTAWSPSMPPLRQVHLQQKPGYFLYEILFSCAFPVTGQIKSDFFKLEESDLTNQIQTSHVWVQKSAHYPDRPNKLRQSCGLNFVQGTKSYHLGAHMWWANSVILSTPTAVKVIKTVPLIYKAQSHKTGSPRQRDQPTGSRSSETTDPTVKPSCH